MLERENFINISEEAWQNFDEQKYDELIEVSFMLNILLWDYHFAISSHGDMYSFLVASFSIISDVSFYLF